MAGKTPSRLKNDKAHLSKPYERPKSLLQNVVSTVRDLLMPSWLAMPLRNNASPGEEEEDRWQDSRAPSEVDREQLRIQPSGQQARSSYSFASRSEVADERDRADLSAQELLLNGDSHSEKSEASTSGCSSLAAGAPGSYTLSPASLELLQQDLSHTRDFGVNAGHAAPRASTTRAATDGSLSSFPGDLRVPQQSTPSVHRPSFSLSAFAAPPGSLKRPRLQSPYYAGRTTFGGVAAYDKFHISSTPLVARTGATTPQPVAVQLRERRPRDDGTPDCLSDATRRILRALEKRSSPLSEAKKMPLDRGLLGYTPASQRRRTPYTPSTGPPVSGLARFGPPRIARNLDPLVSSTKKEASQADTPSAAEPSTKAAPCREEAREGFATAGRAGGKVARARVIHSSRKPDQRMEEAPPPPDLPDVPLPVTSLPSFSFRLPAPGNAATKAPLTTTQPAEFVFAEPCRLAPASASSVSSQVS